MGQIKRRRLDMIVDDTLQALYIIGSSHRPNMLVLYDRIMCKVLKWGESGFNVLDGYSLNRCVTGHN